MSAYVIPANSIVKAILILMHGYGTCYEDFIPVGNFIAQYTEGVEVHLVDGYKEVSGAKHRKWFDLESDNPEDWKRDIPEAGDKMKAYIEEVLKKHPGLTKKDVIVSGFSQGAMMALHVGLKESLGGVIAFSGALVDDKVVAANDGNTKVLIIHGDADKVITLQDMMSSCAKLFDLNIAYEGHIEPKLEHAININCLRKCIKFIEKVVNGDFHAEPSPQFEKARMKKSNG